MKKVKNILFRIEIEGQGIVNFDSSEQKWVWNSLTKNKEKSNHDNVSFGKKNWYIDGVDDDGKPKASYKLKISSNCLKHEIFKNGLPFQNTNINLFPELLMAAIATPDMLLRGYMLADKEETIKRTSPISITDAEQISNAISNLETFSTTGEKVVDDTKAGNTFFKKETVGEMRYSAIGCVDLMQLRFLSCDAVYDRFGLNADYFNIWKKTLQKYIPNLNCKLGYYKISNSVINVPELGIYFSDADILFMVKDFFKKLMLIDIKKSAAFAKISKIEYMLVYNPLEDKISNNDGWKSIQTVKDVDAINFQTEEFYSEEEFETAKKLRKDIEDENAKRKNMRKEEKDKKTAEKKSKKSKKDTEKKS